MTDEEIADLMLAAFIYGVGDGLVHTNDLGTPRCLIEVEDEGPFILVTRKEFYDYPDDAACDCCHPSIVEDTLVRFYGYP